MRLFKILFLISKMQILSIIKQHLIANFGDAIQDVILFGSRVNGTANENSDYDILIVLNCGYDWQYAAKISAAMYEIDVKYNIFTDNHLISIDELKNSLRGSEPIFQRAIQKGLYAA